MPSDPPATPAPRANRRSVWYWRAENFRGLSELTRLLADDADLNEYVEYLRLRQRGLRKDAFQHLGRFIAAAQYLDAEGIDELPSGVRMPVAAVERVARIAARQPERRQQLLKDVAEGRLTISWLFCS